jgi:hypothetical protein
MRRNPASVRSIIPLSWTTKSRPGVARGKPCPVYVYLKNVPYNRCESAVHLLDVYEDALYLTSNSYLMPLMIGMLQPLRAYNLK